MNIIPLIVDTEIKETTVRIREMILGETDICPPMYTSFEDGNNFELLLLFLDSVDIIYEGSNKIEDKVKGALIDTYLTLKSRGKNDEGLIQDFQRQIVDEEVVYHFLRDELRLIELLKEIEYELNSITRLRTISMNKFIDKEEDERNISQMVKLEEDDNGNIYFKINPTNNAVRQKAMNKLEVLDIGYKNIEELNIALEKYRKLIYDRYIKTTEELSELMINITNYTNERKIEPTFKKLNYYYMELMSINNLFLITNTINYFVASSIKNHPLDRNIVNKNFPFMVLQEDKKLSELLAFPKKVSQAIYDFLILPDRLSNISKLELLRLKGEDIVMYPRTFRVKSPIIKSKKWLEWYNFLLLRDFGGSFRDKLSVGVTSESWKYIISTSKNGQETEIEVSMNIFNEIFTRADPILTKCVLNETSMPRIKLLKYFDYVDDYIEEINNDIANINKTDVTDIPKVSDVITMKEEVKSNPLLKELLELSDTIISSLVYNRYVDDNDCNRGDLYTNSDSKLNKKEMENGLEVDRVRTVEEKDIIDRIDKDCAIEETIKQIEDTIQTLLNIKTKLLKNNDKNDIKSESKQEINLVWDIGNIKDNKDANTSNETLEEIIDDVNFNLRHVYGMNEITYHNKRTKRR